MVVGACRRRFATLHVKWRFMLSFCFYNFRVGCASWCDSARNIWTFDFAVCGCLIATVIKIIYALLSFEVLFLKYLRTHATVCCHLEHKASLSFCSCIWFEVEAWNYYYCTITLDARHVGGRTVGVLLMYVVHGEGRRNANALSCLVVAIIRLE